jgi:hypothetical protein
MASTDQLARRCPECGAALDPREHKCWLCHRSLAIDAQLVPERREPAAQNRQHVNPLQFSLESLLLVTTLIAVCLGAAVSMPGLGMVALFVAVPALVRTCLTGVAAKQTGQRLTATDKIMTFFASSAITLAAFLAAGIAFFTACTVSVLTGAAVAQVAGSSPPVDAVAQFLILIAVILCCAVSIAAFVGIFWTTWPRKGR